MVAKMEYSFDCDDLFYRFMEFDTAKTLAEDDPKRRDARVTFSEEDNWRIFATPTENISIQLVEGADKDTSTSSHLSEYEDEVLALAEDLGLGEPTSESLSEVRVSFVSNEEDTLQRIMSITDDRDISVEEWGGRDVIRIDFDVHLSSLDRDALVSVSDDYILVTLERFTEEEGVEDIDSIVDDIESNFRDWLES